MTISTCDLEVDPETCTDAELVRVTHVALVRGKAGRRQVPGYAVGFTLPEPSGCSGTTGPASSS